MPRHARDVGVAPARSVNGSTSPTGVLDWASPRVGELEVLVGAHESMQDRDWLCHAHRAITERVRPVYALNDMQSTSKTLQRSRGSCSQRLAVLESLARRRGIPTRVEGIVVDGRFWYPRFRKARWLVPDRVVLAWPEFHLAGRWTPVGELFDAKTSAPADFTNAGEETLFDAIGRTGVVWNGDCPDGVCDLSAQVIQSLGYFNHRDELFTQHGQTLCRSARVLGEPVMSRRSSQS